MYLHTQVVNCFVGNTHTERQIMSAILEEGIGFGGTNAKNTTWDRIKDKYPVKDPNAPYNTAAANFPSSSQDPFRVELSAPPVNLDPALKELKEKRESMNIVPQKPTEPKPEEVKVGLEKLTNESTEEDIREIVRELEEDAFGSSSEEPFQPVSEKKKSLEETKKLIENFRDKVAKYPKHISYEGSMVLCVLLSMKEEAFPHISNLPLVDQQLVRSLLSKQFNDQLDYFSVVFDENKDFILSFTRTIPGVKEIEKSTETVTLNMFNSVAHPRPEDLRDSGAGVVPVEKDGDRISVGGKILMNKKGIKRLIGVEPLKRNTVKQEENEEFTPKRQPVAGRNAYEIRADVLQIAVEWASRKNVADQFTDPDDIVDLAKKFYQFVENKR